MLLSRGSNNRLYTSPTNKGGDDIFNSYDKWKRLPNLTKRSSRIDRICQIDPRYRTSLQISCIGNIFRKRQKSKLLRQLTEFFFRMDLVEYNNPRRDATGFD